MSLFSLVHKNSGSSIYSAGKAYFLCHIGCRLFRRIRRERKNSVHAFLPGKLQNFVPVSGADQEALVSFSSPRCIRKIISKKDGETQLMRFSYCRKLLETASQDQDLHVSSGFLSAAGRLCGVVALWCVMTTIPPAHISRLFCILDFFFQLPDR